MHLYTSGKLSLPSDKAATETDSHTPPSFSTRALSKENALSYKDKGVRGIAVRLPLTVHGKGDQDFLPSIITAARNKGESPYIDDDQNAWPAVHVLDASVVFRLAFEKGIACHVYHSISETGIKTKDIASTIIKSLRIPAILVWLDEAQEPLGFLGIFIGINNRVSNEVTRKELGWIPKQILLLEDITSDDYLNSIGKLAP